MSIYRKLASAIIGTILGIATNNTTVAAATFFEIGDAGDTFNSAQVVRGWESNSLNWIEGSLSSTHDNDYFRFAFGGVGVLTIQTGPYFNTPFPWNQFPAFQLFNAQDSLVGGYSGGSLTFGLGDMAGSSIFFIPGMSQFNFSNLSAGEYVLKVNGMAQINTQESVYEGDYSIKLVDAEFISNSEQPVPEPSTLLGMIVAGGIGWLMHTKR